jgi:hypothetical protein
MPILKIFVPRAEGATLAGTGQLIASYDAFTVLRLDEAAARRLARQYPSEDITDQYRLPLGGTEVDPLAAAPATPRLRSAVKSASVDAAPHHYLVQFIGPVKAAWVTALKRAGAVVRHPTSGFGYVVRANGEALARIRQLPYVRWSGQLPHADRVAPALGPEAATPTPRRRVVAGALTVDTFAATDLPRIAQEAEALGFKVTARDKAASRLSLDIDGTPTQIRQRVKALSAVHGVRWIGQRVIPRTSNNKAAGLLAQTGAASAPPSGLGLSGQGEIIGICDTGLDSGDASAIHPDFAGRVLAIKSYPITPYWASYVTNPGANDGAADLDSGHGTHVAGSVLGSGAASAAGPARISGMAPAAKLVFQAVEQEMRWKPGVPSSTSAERYILAGIPDNLQPLFSHAFGLGARIHSNSWGGGDPGAYDAQCTQFDTFVWKNKDMCFVIAAGNDGSDPDASGVADGKVNPGSVSSPGTAKNCITVGACENLRPEFNSETYGGWWPDDFPKAPLKDDPMADNPQQVVAFSSRGPTNDGRVKPDVVAPGTWILSTRSTRIATNNFGWGAYTPNHSYFFMGGTSMATPLTAGCVALLREHLRKKRGIASPTAALLKATLIAGAERLPGQAAAKALLDSAQGFGRVNIERSLRGLQLSSEGAGLRTGQISTSTLTLGAKSTTLRIVLAYSDYPGAGLINNLNLIVTSPAGKRHVGNQGGNSLVADSKNNVEVVQVANAAAGNWKIDVVASNVSQGPQDFALAAVTL